MDLNEIKDPSFLKEMKPQELSQLAKEIRQFIIENVSHTGGHLSSNLGVVELTIALHYVFNAPEDKIFFDVGHQCYTHKILTGRASEFSTLRKYKGISGFQKRKESVYDCFEAGHSSTSLSAALGMAVARDMNNGDYDIVPVIGDGALLSGMSFEALNQIGYEKRKMIIIFNDNKMSISGNVGALSKSFGRLRSSKGYTELKGDVKSYLRTHKYGEALITGIHNFKDSIKNQVIDSGIFKEFNLEYYGPVDGHNIAEMIRVLQTAKKEEGPCVIHIITTKGKGYKYAENDVTGKWHGVGPFNKNDGKMLSSTPKGYATGSEIVARKIEEMMITNEDIVAITPAMKQGSALEHVFAHYPERSFDCGIAEEHAMTFAAGLALGGKRPFLAIYSTFMQRAYDQLNHDICRMDLPVVLGIDRAGLVGADGETHHGVFDIGLMEPLPNMIIAQGKDAPEMRALLDYAFSQKHPFALRFARETVDMDPDENRKITSTDWEYLIKNENEDAVILSYGFDVKKIAETVKDNNLNYTVVNCRFLKPFDEKILDEVLASDAPVYIYECDMHKGGFGMNVLDYANSKGICKKIVLSGIPDHYVEQGSTMQLKEEMMLDLPAFFHRIEEDIK